MVIYQRGETMAHWETIRNRNNTKVDPSSVSITIKDPCDFTLVSSGAMTKDTVGIYYYNYDTISSSATYGKYELQIVSTSATGQKGIHYDKFYVMPWEVTTDVRQIVGASETKDIDDDDLSDLCWKAYKEALRDVYNHHYAEAPKCNPDTGAGFNGTNTSFQTKNFPVADINGDGTVLGNNTSCATDVDGWWINNSGSHERAVVVISKFKNGEIAVYQNDGSTAIPANNEGVYIDYWSSYDSYDEDIFRNAVSHLAADMLMRRLKETDRVTLGDIASNIPILVKDSRRFYSKYRELIAKIRKPRVGGI